MGILPQLKPGGLRRVEAAVLLGGIAAFALAPELPGVPLCPVKWLVGRDCPTCGVTRALFALMHGHMSAAAALNPIAFIVVLIVLRRLWLLFFAQSGLARLLALPAVERGLLAAFFALGWWHVLSPA